MSEKYPLWRRLREEIFSQLIRDQWGPYDDECKGTIFIKSYKLIKFIN
jgi:hypothetical protein